MKGSDYEGNYIVKAVRKVYENPKLPLAVCFDIAEIDHTLEGTTSQKETVDFYKSFFKAKKND